jgi:hypothetical protein
VLADESTWTIEDAKLLRILLVKVGGAASLISPTVADPDSIGFL